MGYYTKYTIHDDSEKLLEELEKLSNYSFYIENGVINSDEIKWYDYDLHMSIISQKYPDTVFKISGIGEETGDLWAMYFKNGKAHRAKASITFEPFDESKLREVER